MFCRLLIGASIGDILGQFFVYVFKVWLNLEVKAIVHIYIYIFLWLDFVNDLAW